MNIHDFRYMWRGKPLQPLTRRQAHLLAPIDIRSPKRDRALLLLHGFSSSPAVYRELLPALASYDALVCPTLPGHGESISAFSKTKAEAWVLAAEQACEALFKDYHHVDVMGLSLGGLLACHLSNHFALNHLYLLAPALALQINIPIALKCAQILHRLGFNRLRNQAGNLYSQQHCELAYRQLPITTIIEVLNLIQEFQFIAPTCPVDLFLGKADIIVNSNLVAEYFSHLPNAHIHWLEKSAHVLPLDSDIGTIIGCVQKNV